MNANKRNNKYDSYMNCKEIGEKIASVETETEKSSNPADIIRHQLKKKIHTILLLNSMYLFSKYYIVRYLGLQF